MGRRRLPAMVRPLPRGIAASQLRRKVPPLIHELTTRLRDPAAERRGLFDPSGIEVIAPRRGFPMDPAQIAGDRSDRVLERAETLELRVMTIPAGAAKENRLRQQGLPPEGDQSRSIEVPRMESPEPH